VVAVKILPNGQETHFFEHISAGWGYCILYTNFAVKLFFLKKPEFGTTFKNSRRTKFKTSNLLTLSIKDMIDEDQNKRFRAAGKHGG
jgi:hypothetical protein